MRRFFAILVFIALSISAFAQIDTRIVDSLQEAYAMQEGRDKVLTMIELTWDFYDVSFDDCIDWGEKAIKEANRLGYKDLEAKAGYVLGIQYAYHADLDLARQYLKKAFSQFDEISDTKNAFESLWQLATYELTLGNIDTAYYIYEKAMPMAEEMNDTSACAYIVSNMGLIEYKRGRSEKAYQSFDHSRRMFESIGDEHMALRSESGMATICYEQGRTEEARELYWRIIPKMEHYEDYYSLLGICNNMGMIYGDAFIDYDSAMYYLQKALLCSEMPIDSKDYEVLVKNEKSEVLVQMANLFARRGENQEAVAKYEEALLLAEKNSYLYGQMEACIGLGKVYGKLGQAARSLHYFRRYVELEKATGVTMMRSSARSVLAMDFARLGMFDDLEAELEDLEESSLAMSREMADVHEQNRILREEASDLFDQYETQGAELRKEQTLARHYRLAFYGLLALVLSAVVLALLYKIVRKKQPKIEKG